MNKILFVASEAVPFATSGGLGDVIGSLPAAIRRARLSADIRAVIPMHRNIIEKYKFQMRLLTEFTVYLGWRRQYCGVWEYEHDGIKFYFIDNEYYFKRNSLYGDYDDGERYAYFCKAVMEMMPRIGFIPDILHCHDWQAALCVIYLKRKYCYLDGYSNMKAVYTIHNIGYQGKYGFEILSEVFCLDSWDRYIVEYDGCINLTKGAIVCCDKLTTVSPNYANEIQTDYYSEGLSHIIHMYSYKTCGIVNGIDTDEYDPAKDENIKTNFSLKTIKKKAENKAELQRIFGLPEKPDTPVIAMISRLVNHKGFDLVRYVADELMNTSDVQMVLLGTGDYELENFFRGLKYRHPDKFGLELQFNKDLAKQIYASADIFLMPSRTEPCGLAQMIASRYGTVPVVRMTGGLYDTIKAYNPETGEGNGFNFGSYNAHDMLDAIHRALAVYRDKKQWSKVVSNAMKIDFSWEASARQYLAMYDDIQ